MQPCSVLATVLFAFCSFTATSMALPWSAGDVTSHILHDMVRQDQNSKDLRRDVDEILVDLQRRQTPSISVSATTASPSATPTNSPVIDAKTWDAQARTACTQALNLLNGTASSDSGIAVCYNLPYLSNSTGKFLAELRLYRVSPPIKGWVGVADQNVSIGVDFVGASVTSSNGLKSKRNNVEISPRGGTTSLSMLQSFNFSGQISANELVRPMNATQLQTILSPTVVLTGVNGQRKQVSTTLSSKEASFVNGVMASNTTATSNTGPNAPFVMPGLTLGIFPVGLIITSSWAALGIAVVAWGTVGRYQFREHYRRRKRRGDAAVVRAI